MVKKNSKTSKKNEKRDNFSDSTKKLIFENSGYCCAYPSCYEYVLLHNNKNKPTNSGWGQGAHIYDANKTTTIRPRPPETDESFIKSEKNGMLLCSNHHKVVDSKENKITYPAEILFSYKKIIEHYVDLFLKKKTKKNYNELNDFEKKELYTYLKNMSYKDPSNLNLMDDKELLFFHAFQSLHGLQVKIDKNDLSDIESLKQIHINIDDIFFQNNINTMKSLLSEDFKITEVKLQTFQLIDVTVLSKKYRNISKKIMDVEFKYLNENKYIMNLNYFHDNVFLNNFLDFSLIFDFFNNKMEPKIKLNLDYLKNSNIEIINIKDITIFYELIESLYYNEMEFIIHGEHNKSSKIDKLDDHQLVINNDIEDIRKFSHLLEMTRQISLRDSITISTNTLFSNMNSCLISNALTILKWLSDEIADTVIMPSINHKKSIKNIEIFKFEEVSYCYEITFINFNTQKDKNNEKKINLIKTENSKIHLNLFTS